jgi:hypothetical protein
LSLVEGAQPLISIFSAPKPFIDSHIDLIQRNAIRSWLALGERVEILLIGDEEGIDAVASKYGLQLVDNFERNKVGTPLISSIFTQARAASQAPILAYLNTDIILLNDFLRGVEKVAQKFPNFLMIGQRWDLDVDEKLEFTDARAAELKIKLHQAGKLHPPGGSDYFIFPRPCFMEIPSFALGRAGWDNWMIYAGRHQKLPVVDATESITVIHQNHDYAHLPDNQPHYRLPETIENIGLAGGREMIFSIKDANWRLVEGELERGYRPDTGYARMLEANLISTLKPGILTKIIGRIFHIGDALKYYWTRFRSHKGGPSLM